METQNILLLCAAMLAAGMLGGITAGLLGVGGGIIVVPILYQVFSLLDLDPAIRMHMAVGTSLATIIPTSMSSARAHWKRGGIDTTLLKDWAPWIVAGVLIGSLLAGHVSSAVLGIVFASIAVLVALNMFLRSDAAPVWPAAPTGFARAVVATSIGGTSTLMGIGGGTLSVPILTACSYPIRRAVGTSSALGILISVPGAVGFAITGLAVAGRPPLSIGYISLVGFALLVPTAILLAPVGARLAHSIKPQSLRLLFGLFLLASAVRIGAGAVSALW